MPNSNDTSFASALQQNWLLIGLTAISLAISSAEHLRPALANPSSREVVPAIAPNLSQFCQQEPSSQVLVRTELFFGRGKSNAAEVTELEFQQFLTREITPQFPDGLTLLTGRGQFKNARGQVIKEPANVLILLYPLERSHQHHQTIEYIRNAYKVAFQQGSVLRTDELTCGSF